MHYERSDISRVWRWREFWKWPKFRSLIHQAALQKKGSNYFEELMTDLELAEKTCGPFAVQAIIFRRRKALHEAEWDTA
jgi:hypothetical protein